MAWLPDGKKKFEDIFIGFGTTHERDRQTDRRTDKRTDPRAGIYRAYAYASRGEKSQGAYKHTSSSSSSSLLEYKMRKSQKTALYSHLFDHHAAMTVQFTY